ncbi:hypothetical protein ACT3SP_08795 [Brachybacterium sp. AOP43-C2-M15]|uniref:hypothetical protein n=1 Tax=Brachybacterium sp. AOP43-C2-M15 TaxID=3457661 RepID=UPI004034DC1B
MHGHRRGRRTAGVRGRSAAVLLAAAALTLSGCSLLDSGDPAPPPTDPTSEEEATPREGTLLPEGTTEAEVGVGESVQVALPEGSLGVGDYWGVVSVEDPGIAEADVAIGEDVVGERPDGSGDGEGGTQAFAIEISGIEAGETTVRVLYCTRTREVSEDCDQSHGTLEPPVEPVEIVVRVG